MALKLFTDMVPGISDPEVNRALVPIEHGSATSSGWARPARQRFSEEWFRLLLFNVWLSTIAAESTMESGCGTVDLCICSTPKSDLRLFDFGSIGKLPSSELMLSVLHCGSISFALQRYLRGLSFLMSDAAAAVFFAAYKLEHLGRRTDINPRITFRTETT
jgi:hypothetical protein